MKASLNEMGHLCMAAISSKQAPLVPESIDDVGLYGTAPVQPLSVDFGAAEYEVTEGATAAVEITLNRVYTEDVTVTYRTDESYAIPDRDFVAVGGTAGRANCTDCRPAPRTDALPAAERDEGLRNRAGSHQSNTGDFPGEKRFLCRCAGEECMLTIHSKTS